MVILKLQQAVITKTIKCIQNKKLEKLSVENDNCFTVNPKARIKFYFDILFAFILLTKLGLGGAVSRVHISTYEQRLTSGLYNILLENSRDIEHPARLETLQKYNYFNTEIQKEKCFKNFILHTCSVNNNLSTKKKIYRNNTN